MSFAVDENADDTERSLGCIVEMDSNEADNSARSADSESIRLYIYEEK